MLCVQVELCAKVAGEICLRAQFVIGQGISWVGAIGTAGGFERLESWAPRIITPISQDGWECQCKVNGITS